MEYKVRVTISDGVVMETARLTNSTFKAILSELEFAISIGGKGIHSKAEVIDIATGKILHKIIATRIGENTYRYNVDGAKVVLIKRGYHNPIHGIEEYEA